MLVWSIMILQYTQTAAFITEMHLIKWSVLHILSIMPKSTGILITHRDEIMEQLAVQSVFIPKIVSLSGKQHFITEDMIATLNYNYNHDYWRCTSSANDSIH